MIHRATAILCLPLLALICWGCGDDEAATEPTPTVIGSSWRLVETGITNTVRAFASNDSTALLVGDGGIIYSSADGTNWERRRETGPDEGLQDVLWFDSLFIAVGANGTLLTSPDGAAWTWVGADGSANMTALAASDSTVVAVGQGGAICTSFDGIQWVSHNQESHVHFTDVCHKDSIWVACSSNGLLYHSTNGTSWEQATSSLDEMAAVASDGDYFYTVSIDIGADSANRCKLYYSPDGDGWFHESDLDAWYIHDLFWTGDSLVAVGDGTEYNLGYPDGVIFSSVDGAQWSALNSDAPFSLTCIGQFKGRTLVGGSGGYVLVGSSPSQLSVVASGAELTGIVWTGSEFVAVTDRGTVMRSPDGDTWSETHSHASAGFERLAFSGSEFAALGGFGVSTEIYSSPDGATWNRTLEFQNLVLKDITWGNGKFLACGQDGALFLSDDGQAWTRHYVGDSVTLRAVIWDGSRFLAASLGMVYTSNDGIDWTKPEVDSTYQVPSISRFVWTGSIYCAVGTTDSASIGLQAHAYVSTDALRWQFYTIPVSDYLYDLAWTGTRLVACGRDGVIVSSTNGKTWQVVAVTTEQSLKDLAVGGGRAVAGGSNRTVLVSP